jgi:hypothetical protein
LGFFCENISALGVGDLHLSRMATQDDPPGNLMFAEQTLLCPTVHAPLQPAGQQ